MSPEQAFSQVSVARVFAELPFAVTWLEVLNHVGRLADAEVTAFFADEDENWLHFTHRKYEFCIRSRDAKLCFEVDDAHCSTAQLMEVIAHFTPLLSPGKEE